MMIVTLVLLTSSIGFAAAKCSVADETLHACKSTPKPVDSEFVIGTLDSIAICQKNARKTTMVIEKNGESEEAEAKVSGMAGGTRYSIKAGNTTFSLSVTGGTRPGPLSKATLTIDMRRARMTGSSTYTCYR